MYFFLKERQQRSEIERSLKFNRILFNNTDKIHWDVKR